MKDISSKVSIVAGTVLLLLIFVPRTQKVESSINYQLATKTLQTSEIETQNTISFSAETIEDVAEIATVEIELPVTTYNIAIDEETQKAMSRVCDSYNVDFKLALSVAYKETKFDNDYIGDSGNSHGMYQIQPKWWSSKINGLDLFDYVESTEAFCIVWNYLYEHYDTTVRALNAYVSGNPDYYNGYSTDVLKIYEELETK